MATIFNRSLLQLWNLLRSWTRAGSFESGSIYLCAGTTVSAEADGNRTVEVVTGTRGRQELAVHTEGDHPEKVWLSVTPLLTYGCQQVCGGDLTFVSQATPTCDGFVFSVILNTSAVKIDWLAQF